MADGFVDRVKFTGNRIGTGAVTSLVREAPYRLPTDVKGVGSRVFLEIKSVGDDSIWEHGWYEVEAGGQLSVYRVIDTHERSGEYDPQSPPAAISFDGPVECGAIANSVTLPVIGPDGETLLNGKTVRSALLWPDVVTLQARDDLEDGDRFFAMSSLHTPNGGGASVGAGPGLLLEYDADAGDAHDGVDVFSMSSGAPGRLKRASLEVQARFIREEWSVYADGTGVARSKLHALQRGAAGADDAWAGMRATRGNDGADFTDLTLAARDRQSTETDFLRLRSYGDGKDRVDFLKPFGLAPVPTLADVLPGMLARVAADERVYYHDADRGLSEIPLVDGGPRARAPNVAALRGLKPDGYQDNEIVVVDGSLFRGDGDAFLAYWSSGSTTADNGFDVFKPDEHADGAPWTEAGRFLALTPIRIQILPDGEASPDLSSGVAFRVAATPPFGGYDFSQPSCKWRNNKTIVLHPGPEDALISYVAGAVETPHREHFFLRTRARGGSPITLIKENGVVSLLPAGGNSGYFAPGGVATATDGVLTLEPGKRYTLPAGEFDGVAGLAPNESAQFVLPTTGVVTFVDAQAPSSGVVFALGADRVFAEGEKTVYTLTNEAGGIRLTPGGGAGGASNISIDDVGENYAAPHVEAALAEIADRLPVSVRAFGAVGDGITDDRNAVHAAITAAGVGGVVHFPRCASFYRVGQGHDIRPLSGQTWIFDAMVKKHSPSIARTDNLVVLNAVNDVTFIGRGGGLGYTSGNHLAIHTTGACNGFRLIGMRIDRLVCFHEARSRNIRYIGCEFTDATGQAINAIATGGLVNPTTGVVTLEPGLVDGLLVEGCYFNGWATEAIDINCATHNWIITNCLFDNVGTEDGNEIIDAGGTVVASATVNAGGTGYTNGDTLTVSGGNVNFAATFTATVSGGVVTALTLDSPGYYYRLPEDLTGVTLTGGTGAGCTADLVAHFCAHGVVTNNTFNMAAYEKRAIRIKWHTVDVAISNNTARYENQATTAVEVVPDFLYVENSDDVRAENNRAENFHSGVRITGPANNVKISGNIFINTYADVLGAGSINAAQDVKNVRFVENTIKSVSRITNSQVFDINNVDGIHINENYSELPSSANDDHGYFRDNCDNIEFCENTLINGNYGAFFFAGVTRVKACGNSVEGQQREALYFQGQNDHSEIDDNRCKDNGNGASVYAITVIDADWTSIRGNKIWDQLRGLRIVTGGANNIVTDNMLDCTTPAIGLDLLTSSIVKDNLGYVTEASGVATISNGSTTVVVSHGLAETPAIVSLTPRASIGSATKPPWVTSLGASQFTINVDADPGADVDVQWVARRAA